MRRALRSFFAAACAACLSSCAAISVNDLPQPGTSYSDGYNIVLEFANVLNLPDRAKVVMDGTTVGVVEKVAVTKAAVDVTARIDHGVTVPADSRAVLQQATVLGDIYVAIDRPADARTAGTQLAPNGRIPLSQTTAPPQLEDTLATVANFIGSGSIQRIQNTIIGINRVTPERRDQVRAIAARFTTDMGDLSNNIDTVDQWLNGLSGTAAVMAADAPKLGYWVSPAGQTLWDRMTTTAIGLGTLVPSVGSIYTGGYWLVPLLNSLGLALGEIQKSKWAVEGEYAPWRKIFTEMFLPQDKYPAMNITSVQTADGRDITTNTDQVLRMLGAIP